MLPKGTVDCVEASKGLDINWQCCDSADLADQLHDRQLAIMRCVKMTYFARHAIDGPLCLDRYAGNPGIM